MSHPQQNADWDRDTAKDVCATFLKTYDDLKVVFPWLDYIRDVIFMGDHCIFGEPDLLPVKPDVRQAVYSLKIQDNPLSFRYFRSIEDLAVHPLAEFVRPEVIDVIPDLRILDHPSRQQIQLNVAGNCRCELGGLQCRHFSRVCDSHVFLRPELEIPFAVQGYLFLGKYALAHGQEQCHGGENKRSSHGYWFVYSLFSSSRMVFAKAGETMVDRSSREAAAIRATDP